MQSDTLVIRMVGADARSTVPIFVDCWEAPAGSKERVLLILHGLGEHGGRYRHVPAGLEGEFRRFYAMDQRGHGKSGGLRGFAPSFGALTGDLERVVEEVRAREAGRPMYLLAHSFGGLVALRFLLASRAVPLQGAILSAPLLGLTLKVPGYKKILGEVLGRTLSKVQLANEVNPAHLSHDPRVAAAYVSDPLVHNKITPRLYLDMRDMMDWVVRQKGPLACPALFLVPGDDRIVDSERTLALASALKDVELREYSGFFHELLNETGKDRVFGDIRAWLSQR